MLLLSVCIYRSLCLSFISFYGPRVWNKRIHSFIDQTEIMVVVGCRRERQSQRKRDVLLYMKVIRVVPSFLKWFSSVRDWNRKIITNRPCHNHTATVFTPGGIVIRCGNNNRACKLFNIRLYATLCFNYFRWHRRMFSYGSVFELLIC